MDHATRHLSSPSPTSTFLFHHSEKSYKSSSDLLAPILSSETEDSDVNACFTTTATGSATIENYSPNPSDDDSNVRCNRQDTDALDGPSGLTDGLRGDTDDGVPLILGQFGGSSKNSAADHSEEANLGVIHHSESNKLNVDIGDDDEEEEDDDDDDDDENMRNVLSGSSRSSATTMPLLTDAHTHHSFSERISLEEYSPLSLVNDCDNALPMSPTSLACGSHHSSFKSSLNNLKIDHLGVDGVGDVGVHGVDDVVGDTRSMSPSLLSNPNHHHNHHNMWSNSSTAITQNPSLLTSNSTSILLSQHSHHPNQHSHHHTHHHQINTLMQSLDETPPLIGNNGTTTTLDTDLSVGQPHQVLLHRPSSEPPLNSSLSASTNMGAKSVNGSASTSSSSAMKMTTSSSGSSSRARKQSSSISANSGNLSSASSSNPASGGLSSSCSTTSRSSSSKVRGSRSRTRNTKVSPFNNNSSTTSVNCLPETKTHNSKLHLQLNHHKKLKELQQRLFGNVASTSEPNGNNNGNKGSNECVDDKSECLEEKLSDPKVANVEQTLGTNTKPGCDSKEEADSSAGQDIIASTTGTTKLDQTVSHSKSTMTKAIRQTAKRKRPPRGQTASNKNPTTLSSQNSDNGTATRSSQKIVKTETAEPDTTTKSSDCLKLADLLAPNNNSFELTRTNGNFGIVLGADSLNRINGGDSNSERKIQHIQLQMNPSLTVVANNNGLIQPINIQQHQLQLSNNDGVIAASSNNQSNQIVRQPNTTIASLIGVDNNGSLAGTQFKCNIVSNGDANFNGSRSDSMKRDAGEEALDWQGNSSNNQSNINTGASNLVQPTTATIGAHQIAIQVICQDGTSLVLPVSSAAGLNTAVALSAQNQAHIQAILSNTGNNSVLFSNCQQMQRSNGTQQIIPVVTMINQNQAKNSGITNSNMSGQNQSSAGSTTSSGLAASSPTLAALLDAGSSRGPTLNVSMTEAQQGQNLIPNNLLRKIVATSSITQNQIVAGDNGNTGGISGDACGSTRLKRIKLEQSSETGGNNSIRATTFTLIDPQGLIVTNSNENNNSNDSSNNNNNNNKGCSDMPSGVEPAGRRIVAKLAASSHQLPSNTDSMQAQQISMTNISTNSNNGGNKNKAGQECSTNKQNTKMTSSTGNRQVDPAQPFRCEHCNSTFTRLGNFTRHKKIHTVPTRDGQRFRCDVCSKSFLQRCDLARHLHIHRGTEPHRCNICGKGYIRHSDLVTHQRFHNKEKPFGCPHCSKGFCQRGDLNRHLRSIHLQMKPILCPCCNRKFAKQETLLRHLNTAHRGSNRPAVAGSSGQAVNAELPASSQVTTQGYGKKHNITDVVGNVSLVVSGGALSEAPDNSNNDGASDGHSSLKISAAVPVASLQAIQATLCKVQQSTDSSKKTKMASPSSGEPPNMGKASS